MKRQSRHIRAYRAIASRALGRELPPGAVVHHVDNNSLNNRNNNLVICENDNYHKLLHYRSRAFKASGHADWLKCSYCKEYGPSDELKPNNNKRRGKGYYHPRCGVEYYRRVIGPKIRKGRQYGSAHHKAKFIDSDIPVIRQRVLNGETRRAVARDYKVDRAAIQNIINGTTWSHVK